MSHGKNSLSEMRAWYLAALAAPVAHLASGLGWWTVTLVAGISMAIQQLPGGEERGEASGKRTGLIRWAITVLAVVDAMDFFRFCWPGQKEIQWVMAILLVLAAYLSGKGREQTKEASILLWWFIGFLLGSVLLSSVPEIRARHLMLGRSWMQWQKAIQLLTVLLMPGLLPQQQSRKERLKLSGAVGLMAIIFGVCTQGVLSYGTAAQEKAPFYSLSRSIRLYGALDRMEGLAWLGLLLGCFVYLSLLLTAAGENGNMAWDRGRGWWIAAAAGMAMLGARAGMGVSSPVLLVLILIYGNREKREKKVKS